MILEEKDKILCKHIKKNAVVCKTKNKKFESKINKINSENYHFNLFNYFV